ncbi:VirB4 family type IV secretion system protein [Desulfurispora thermophila]|uniref:VirB4 family type IV secretion system protein n=1 Tax=Desulfurispora thermophila TaxID=265470 RepID=UPI00035E072B|nr:ATP-binding protein [Desulfurispora thermophila]
MNLFRRKKAPEDPGHPDIPYDFPVTALAEPDAMCVYPEHIRLHNHYVRVYVVENIPRMVWLGWIEQLAIGGVVVASYLEPLPDREVISRLTKRETQAASQLILAQNRGHIARIPEYEQAVAELRALRTAVQVEQEAVFSAGHVVAVYGKDPEDLDQRCSYVQDVAARAGIFLRTATWEQAGAFRACLPLAIPPPVPLRTLTSGAASTCLPVVWAGEMHGSGILLGRNISTGAPVLLNRFFRRSTGAEKPNPHMFVSGAPGGGKSVTVRLLTLLEAEQGVKAFIIDPENEYVEFVRALGGQSIFLSPGQSSGMNLLDVGIEGGGRVGIISKVADVAAWLSAVYAHAGGQGLDMAAQAAIEEALRDTYTAAGITEDPATMVGPGGIYKPMPTLSDFAKRLAKLPAGRDVAQAMTPLLRGGSMGYFDCPTTVHLADTPVIGVHLKALSGDFPRLVAMFALLSWALGGFALRGSDAVKKSVVVDEAWMFLRYPAVAQHLEALARRGRKHGCALTIATQRFEEFAASPEGRAVIETCPIRLTLRQEDHAAQAAVDYFHLSGGCRDFLTTAQAGQGILVVDGRVSAVQVEPAPFEWDIVGTKVVERSTTPWLKPGACNGGSNASVD